MEPYRSEKLVAFVAPKHALARRKSVSPSEFSEIQLIVKGRRNGQSRTETQLNDYAKRGIKFKTMTRYVSSGSVKEAVRHGAGVGILFQDTVKREIDQGEFIALQFPGLNVTRQTYIAYSKERPLSPTARDFLLLLRASATKNLSVKTVNPPISIKRPSDYILRSSLLSWITSAASLFQTF
jgi:DNA-binding transcriptional LysR family regulator